MLSIPADEPRGARLTRHVREPILQRPDILRLVDRQPGGPGRAGMTTALRAVTVCDVQGAAVDCEAVAGAGAVAAGHDGIADAWERGYRDEEDILDVS